MQINSILATIVNPNELRVNPFELNYSWLNHTFALKVLKSTYHMLAKDNRQLLYIYSSESNLGKEMLAYAKSIDKPIKTIDISKETISETVWLEIADMIGVTLSALFSPNHPDAPDVGTAEDFIVSDWLKLINHNPSLLQHPIAINCNNAVSIKEKSDMMLLFKELKNKED